MRISGTVYNTRLPDRDIIERNEECEVCHGMGYILEEISSAGYFQEVDCEACKGSGVVIVRR